MGREQIRFWIDGHPSEDRWQEEEDLQQMFEDRLFYFESQGLPTLGGENFSHPPGMQEASRPPRTPPVGDFGSDMLSEKHLDSGLHINISA